MNMDIHRVSDIQVKRNEFETFQTVSVSVLSHGSLSLIPLISSGTVIKALSVWVLG